MLNPPKTNNENMDNPLGYEPIGRLLTRYAIPGVIAMLANALYNVVDQIFIGNGVGYLGNAATTVAFPFNSITLAYCLLIGSGGAAMAAIRLGEGNKEAAELLLGNVLTLTNIISIIFIAISYIFFEPMLTMFGATENIMPYAKDYADIILIGLPFMALGGGA